MMSGEQVSASAYTVLRRRAVRDAGLTVVAAIAAGAVAITTWGLGPLALIKSAAVPLGLVVLVAPHLSEHPLTTLGPANHLTLLRAVCVGMMAAFVGDPAAESASVLLVALALVAFGLDWLDGRVARAAGVASPFGARLDMELDAIMVLVMSMLLWSMGRAGPWVLLAGLARYLFIASGWVWPFMAAELPPTSRRAVACGLGVTGLLAALAPWPWLWLAPTLAAVGTGILAGSFAIDIVWLLRHRSGRV